MIVKCDSCGGEFNKHSSAIKRTKHHFCSQACYRKWYDENKRVKTNCTECGMELYISKYRSLKYNNHFCSKACAGMFKRNRVTTSCDNCGAEIERTVSSFEQFNYHFCNRECEYEWMHNRIEVTCANCGEGFKRKRSQFERANYFFCSRECAAQGRVGELAGNWQGGLSFEPYGRDFNSVLKDQIRDRDNRTCQECGYTEKQLGCKLNVHHLDYNKKNNNPNNLISLCNSCHSQTNFRRADWTAYFKSKLSNIEWQPQQLVFDFMEMQYE